MNWTEAGTPAARIVRLSGEIDLQHSPKLRQLLQGKLGERPPVLMLDFSEVRYIDSSGLATLVEYYKNSRTYSGRLIVAGLSNRVRSIFDLVRLGEVFTICSTLAEAEAVLGGSSTDRPA